jgi:DNA polymerase-1
MNLTAVPIEIAAELSQKCLDYITELVEENYALDDILEFLKEYNGDDLIAYYCHISEDEQKTIFSSDRDLTQLISEKVSVYSPQQKRTYKVGDMIKNKELEFPHYNIKTTKILCGDTSDNIDGIRLLGEKTLVKLFPEILENPTSFNDILTKAELLLKEDKENVALKNLLSGKTKDGIYGEEFFQINEKIIDLSNPYCIIFRSVHP